MRPRYLLLVLSVVILPLCNVAVGRRGLLDSVWTPINDPNDNESNATLKFERVIQGETQVADGIYYRLDVAVIHVWETKNYEAVVYESPSESYKNLTSFTPLSLLPGG
ncbi:Cysteine proteinase inhibitor [Quillaja saponaria]|uniref:Cysteine proteinase inhibitor n=1 Tax=Quillaja saponaria TaxID=32244 RepID=A0AAD7KV39_QUISA|nr:Cysteine proteinase inhibitor [Quillaja saponaria]